LKLRTAPKHYHHAKFDFDQATWAAFVVLSSRTQVALMDRF